MKVTQSTIRYNDRYNAPARDWETVLHVRLPIPIIYKYGTPTRDVKLLTRFGLPLRENIDWYPVLTDNELSDIERENFRDFSTYIERIAYDEEGRLSLPSISDYPFLISQLAVKDFFAFTVGIVGIRASTDNIVLFDNRGPMYSLVLNETIESSVYHELKRIRDLEGAEGKELIEPSEFVHYGVTCKIVCDHSTKTFYILPANKQAEYESGRYHLITFDTSRFITNDTSHDNLMITSANILVQVLDYVYFYRENEFEDWKHVGSSLDVVRSYAKAYNSTIDNSLSLWKRREGRDRLNFNWIHHSKRYELVDPCPSNIIDTFIMTKGYYSQMRDWVDGILNFKPSKPTSFELKQTYSELLASRMISDTNILQVGDLKILFGAKADYTLRGVFKVVQSKTSTLTANQLKTKLIQNIREFFDINYWEFGETFYATELIAYLHNTMGKDIDSVILVPKSPSERFGKLHKIVANENQLFLPDVTLNDIEIIDDINSLNAQFDKVTVKTTTQNLSEQLYKPKAGSVTTFNVVGDTYVRGTDKS